MILFVCLYAIVSVHIRLSHNVYIKRSYNTRLPFYHMHDKYIICITTLLPVLPSPYEYELHGTTKENCCSSPCTGKLCLAVPKRIVIFLSIFLSRLYYFNFSTSFVHFYFNSPTTGPLRMKFYKNSLLSKK